MALTPDTETNTRTVVTRLDELDEVFEDLEGTPRTVLTRTLEWVIEDEHNAPETRYPLSQAVEMASAAALTVTVNGLTAADLRDRRLKQGAFL